MTPLRHRSASPNKSAPGHGGIVVTTTLAPMEPPAAIGASSKIGAQRQHPSHPQPQPRLVAGSSQHLPPLQSTSSPMTTSSATTSGGSTTTLEINGDAASPTRYQQYKPPISSMSN